MHYTNPQGLRGILDSSGASLGVTTKLRPYDVGFMRLGPVEYDLMIRIPPKRVTNGSQHYPEAFIMVLLLLLLSAGRGL